jgi:hypothetical protein
MEISCTLILDLIDKGWIPSSTVNNSNIDVSIDEVIKFCKVALKGKEDEERLEKK